MRATRELPDAEARSLQPGAEHYTSFVGPPDQYDIMGASQFRLLTTFGLRDSHRVLDFGCGSLRAGRLLIPYLQRGGYHGLDPNAWLIEDAIDRQLGRDLVALKWPHFYTFDDFRADRCGNNFDFILAQSIFSHAGADLVETAIQSFAKALAPEGLALFTALQPGQDGVPEFSGSGWIYPGCVAHSPKTITAICSRAGMHSRPLPWFHPRQTWYVSSRDKSRLPLPQFDHHLRGAVLNEPAWQASLGSGNC
jgi:SAM-dependent methyltransferase